MWELLGELLEAAAAAWRLARGRGEPLHRVAVELAPAGGFGTRPAGHAVHVDGSVTAAGAAGVGVWHGAGHAGNAAGHLGVGNASNNVAELAAIYWALLRHPRGARLTVYSDSRHALAQLRARAAAGAFCQCSSERGAPLLLNAVLLLLFLRRAPTTFRKVAAHGASRDNAAADRLAKLGAERRGGSGEAIHVVGVPHPELGQEVAAVVVPREAGADTATLERELAAHTAAELAHYKVPTRWRIDPLPLPRNATGKVVRPAIAP